MQKTLFVFVLAVFVIATTSAQDHKRDSHTPNNSQPPAVVQKSFQNDHPAANGVNWHQTNQQWHSSHTDAGTRMHEDNYYRQNGSRVDSHRELGHNDVPQSVDRHVQQRYHAKDYTAIRIDRPDHSPVFSVDIHRSNGHRKIYTDERGNEIKYYDHH